MEFHHDYSLLYDMPLVLMNGLHRLLVREDVDLESISDVGALHSPFALGSASDSDQPLVDAVLDLARVYVSLVEEAGDPDEEQLDQMISHVNRIPHTIDGGQSPLEVWTTLMKRIPEMGSPREQQGVLLSLRTGLSREEWREISTESMRELIPRIFPSVADFTQACNDFEMECVMSSDATPTETTSESSGQACTDLSLRVRLHSAVSRLGMPMPGRN